MKKLYSVFMLAVMAIAMSFTAKADITVTLKVDDASRLTGYYQYYDANYSYYEETLDLTQFTGDGNTFVIPADYGYVYINATDGNTITSAVNETTGSSSYTGGSTYFYVYEDNTISVTSASLEATRTSSCTVNVDDASKVLLSYYTGAGITLENGSNTVKFNPNGESPFQLQHINYGESLYSVTLNGVDQSAYYGRYEINVNDGDVLDIKADFPDEPSVISFSYGSNESEVLGCVSVKVDGEPVEDFDGKTLTAKLGQKITIEGDNNLYNFNYAITVDGNSTYFYGSYDFVASKPNHSIEINATKYESFAVTVQVDNAENVELYPGTSNNALSIVSGEVTTVELTGNSNYINIRPTTSDCYISSILVNGTEYGSNYGTYSVTVRDLKENDNIVITTGKLSRDKSATVWVDDISAAQYGYSAYRYSDRESIGLISGEAVTVNFDDSDNPYYMSFYMPTVCDIFQNGIYQAPQYEGSTTYYITFADGDAVKIYLAASPEKYAVTFTETVTDAVNSVATDGQAYANWATGFTALTGTKVAVAVDAEKAEVTVDGEKATTDENGNYVVEITKDTNITISEASGVENVTIATVKNNNVYNMQGMLIIENANAEQINALPAGLYIINGQKVIRK